MTGELLKQRLIARYNSLAEVARKIDVSPQALNQTLSAVDIKTGFIERLASAFGVPISIFFEEDISSVHTEGDFSPASVYGNSINNIGDVAVLRERIRALEAIVEAKQETIDLLKLQLGHK